jgi:hypothetical protein
MKLSPRTAQINVRLSPDLKRAAEEAAEAQHRTLSSLIEVLLIEHLTANGQLPSRKKKK